MKRWRGVVVTFYLEKKVLRSFVCLSYQIGKGAWVLCMCEHVFQVSKMKLCLLRIIQLFPSDGAGLLHIAPFKKTVQVSTVSVKITVNASKMLVKWSLTA